MPKLPGVNHLDAIRAPRHNPVNAFTMGGIIRDSGLTIEEFKDLL